MNAPDDEEAADDAAHPPQRDMDTPSLTAPSPGQRAVSALETRFAAPPDARRAPQSMSPTVQSRYSLRNRVTGHPLYDFRERQDVEYNIQRLSRASMTPVQFLIICLIEFSLT